MKFNYKSPTAILPFFSSLLIRFNYRSTDRNNFIFLKQKEGTHNGLFGQLG